MIYFTSDTHYSHKNICRGTSEWKEVGDGGSHQKTRDFDTLEQMNQALVDGINSRVKENDELWHLGDWSFGGIGKIMEFRARLRCKNINLVFGNHDQHIKSGKYLIYLHKDDGIISKNSSGIKDCFNTLQHYKELKINEVHLILSHYAMKVWNKSHHGSIMLYGHSHGTLPGIGKSMDVGVDTNNYKPYSLDEILDIMKDRVSLIVDHHNENTN